MAGGTTGGEEVTRVDLHVKVVDEDVVERAKAAGIDALVYAPHFEHLDTVRERAARFSDEELLVVPGREYFTGTWANRKHVLAVDPDDPVPDFLPLEATMAELHDIVERVNDRVVRLDTGELRICPIPSADDIREALGGEV